tara:strand:- start:130460 stop:131161 length:702 start_codon:yes stop_codon:yes gene_type:complete
MYSTETVFYPYIKTNPVTRPISGTFQSETIVQLRKASNLDGKIIVSTSDVSDTNLVHEIKSMNGTVVVLQGKEVELNHELFLGDLIKLLKGNNKVLVLGFDGHVPFLSVEAYDPDLHTSIDDINYNVYLADVIVSGTNLISHLNDIEIEVGDNGELQVDMKDVISYYIEASIEGTLKDKGESIQRYVKTMIENLRHIATFLSKSIKLKNVDQHVYYILNGRYDEITEITLAPY